MVSFRAKIRVIPNVSYERALICTIKYICYEYSLTNNKTLTALSTKLFEKKNKDFTTTFFALPSFISLSLRTSCSFSLDDTFVVSHFFWLNSENIVFDPRKYLPVETAAVKVNHIHTVIRPSVSSVYYKHSPRWLNLLTKFRLGRSHLLWTQITSTTLSTEPFCSYIYNSFTSIP